MIYLEAANSFNQENEKEDRQRWMWRAYNNSNNSTAIQNMIKDCMETEDIFNIVGTFGISLFQHNKLSTVFHKHLFSSILPLLRGIFSSSPPFILRE